MNRSQFLFLGPLIVVHRAVHIQVQVVMEEDPRTCMGAMMATRIVHRLDSVVSVILEIHVL